MSQTDKILKFLLEGHSLTPMQALKKFGTWALSSRISEIRAMNQYNVKSELIKLKSGKHVSKYSIEI
jgi:hypothetical protein